MLYYMYMKKYNVTYIVYFKNSIKNIDTAVIAKNEDEAEKIADTKLDKYLSKREIDGYELESVEEYNTRDHSADLNKFVEYNPA